MPDRTYHINNDFPCIRTEKKPFKQKKKKMQLHCGMCKLKDIFLTTFSETFRKSKIKRNWFDMNQDGIIGRIKRI